MKFSEFPFFRPDIKKITNDFEELFEKFNSSKSFDGQHKVYLEINEMKREINAVWDISRIKFSLDVNNKVVKEDCEYFDELDSDYSALCKRYNEFLINSKFIGDYEKTYGKKFIKDITMDIRLYTDEIAEDMKLESKLKTEYAELRASSSVVFEGKEITFSELDKYKTSDDRDMRKKAQDLYWKTFGNNKSKIETLLDEIITVRTKMAKKLEFNNFVELGYAKLSKEYTPYDAAKFRESIIKHLVPFSLKLRERQKKRIGIESLKYYDSPLSFKTGNPAPKGNTEWIMEQCIKMYSELSPETKEFIFYMTENQLLDLYPKKGKESGGFCAYISKHKSPFIFANFNGTADDVGVLTHEAGHALQKYLCRNYIIDELINVTSEIGEIHSMSMEFLTYDYMKTFFAEDTDKFYFSHQEDFIFGCLNTVMLDEFQCIIYSQPELSIKERNTEWKNLQRKYFPDMDYDGNEFLEAGCSWQRQSIIFEIPFYSLDYALAQFCAYQFFFRSKINFEKTFREYLEFCKLGGKYTFSEILKVIGLDSPFEEKTVKDSLQKIEEYMNSIDDSKF